MNMRRLFFILVCCVFVSVHINAQEYDPYLRKAFSALEEGNTEVAQSSYNVYKRMTNKTDPDFEVLLDASLNNDWKSKCYIIKLNDSTNIAIQHFDGQKPVSQETAEKIAGASRLGDFTDWRLISKQESYIVLPNIDIKQDLNIWTRSTALVSHFPAPIYVIVNTITYESSYITDSQLATAADVTRLGNIFPQYKNIKLIREPVYNYLIVRTYNKYTE